MKIIWNRDANLLVADGKNFYVTNVVRNELNKWRKLHTPSEVVKAVVNGTWGPPYMPRQFPFGTWKILAVEETSSPEFAPIKIRTDAHQIVHVWALDKNGGYDHETGVTVNDSGYHLHWSKGSHTTLGCGRVGKEDDSTVRELAAIIKTALNKKEEIILEVV